MLDQIRQRLDFIYGDKITADVYDNYLAVIEKYKRESAIKPLWDEKDAFLITYGDTLSREGQKPLNTLHYFVKEKVSDAISIVHILPFFPYSSDDGFSVIDFNKVNPDLGDWEAVQKISGDFRLMADLVVNHISAESDWMQQFKQSEAPGKDFIYTVEDDFDYSQVVRPHSSPLLTPFETPEGVKKVWTTFSEDQIDLNFSNPELTLAMLEILLSYIEKGISVIRLDAIAFLWKRSGTSCLHEVETHELVKLMRAILDYCVPGTILLTETNVPHKENISYFGKGDEAHMVYQFALPPLLLHALHTGNASFLTQWASSLGNPGDAMTYFNFTASHDGIGVRPLEGLLPEDEKESLFAKMKDFGGRINTRRTIAGQDVPYELNITYYDALKGTKDGEDEWQIPRFISSQIIMMTLQGIPAIYIHSLLGTHNYQEGVAETGQNRTINRRKWDYDEITSLLEDNESEHSQVFEVLTGILKIRREQKAFHPDASQEIYDIDSKLFVAYRANQENGESILSVSNMTAESLSLNFDEFEGLYQDLILNEAIDMSSLELEPYQTVWLKENPASCF
ncbi:MAG: sugar phosphorylase [Bacteroidales bacterium]|jgi:glycosidase|nr:sugar phosphorylase [Bacteroidales bacterium]